eukprot:CAMPEP_0202845330 /NCGR_PEP_ID=MMETSP1389-20130828/69833_1 /ASSEMBLY_ACC=CAM_ASM_000865 /TAXON_ID=302021 /ORGANISM="Rhodomonas sp., Strain CCMP768" /LENGTH=199 /DNA_ID=CAMNT_0049522763 /DNA_START=66 /DNA_END=665 /DNA_ORIENTATION=+
MGPRAVRGLDAGPHVAVHRPERLNMTEGVARVMMEGPALRKGGWWTGLKPSLRSRALISPSTVCVNRLCTSSTNSSSMYPYRPNRSAGSFLSGAAEMKGALCCALAASSAALLSAAMPPGTEPSLAFKPPDREPSPSAYLGSLKERGCWVVVIHGTGGGRPSELFFLPSLLPPPRKPPPRPSLSRWFIFSTVSWFISEE